MSDDDDYRKAVLGAIASLQPADAGITTEHWFKAAWRPAMAWLYLAICAFDFLIAPVMNASLAAFKGITYVAWTPMTLQGGGLIHITFAVVLGVAAWGRTREKTAGTTEAAPGG